MNEATIAKKHEEVQVIREMIFKTKITSVVTKAFTNFTRDTGKILA